MPSPPQTRRVTPTVVIVIVIAAALLGAGGYFAYSRWTQRLTSPTSATYRRMVSAFYSGVLAMNVGDDEHAEPSLLAATKLVPREPAAWADLGLYDLRKNDGEQAARVLAKAHEVAPNNGDIEALLAILAKQQGQASDAVAHFRQSIKLDPSNVQNRYALLQTLPQTGEDDGTEVRKQWEQIARLKPGNLFVALQWAASAAKGGDLAQVKTLVAQAATRASGWPADAKEQLASLQKTLASGDSRAAVTQVAFLSNLLLNEPDYKTDRDAVVGDSTVIGTPLENFLALPPPPATPASPDLGLTYAAQPLGATVKPAAPVSPVSVARNFWLDASTQATLLASADSVQIVPAAGKTSAAPVTLPFPGKGVPPTSDGVLPVDWNNDFKTDLVLAGAGGLRFYQQGAGGAFTDVGAKTGLSASVLNAAYAGVWAADIDSDGDLDLILGAPTGPPTVLRNNGDGTWTPIHPFPGAKSGVRAWAMADFDNDGDPDAAFLDGAGKLQLFENRRNGVFAPWQAPADLPPLVALSIADVSHSGALNVVALGQDGVARSLAWDGKAWTVSAIAQLPKEAVRSTGLANARLQWADLDNNGALDLICSLPDRTFVYLSDENAKLQPLAAKIDAGAVCADVVDKPGGVDLVGVAPAGQPVRLVGKGTKQYAYQQVLLHGIPTGDQRNNSFGIGATVELRAGLLYEKQIVTQPVTSFGLGTYAQADYIRILWPNGSPQGEFALKADQTFDAPQRLKGSCPWLFADDGSGMKFVTDLIWRSPLGLRINAQNTAGVAMTRDRVKIAGDQLAPKSGFYDLRVTAELWETHFFDYLKLLTVDHPADTEVFVDERFAIPSPSLAVHVVTPPVSVRRATDDRGQDVTKTVATRDGVYLDTFGRGDYQGVTRDHYIELDLGDAASGVTPNATPWLVAQGWIHPTDSSINLALSQGRHALPTSLSLEIPDGAGGWKTARKNLGFPEGKNKTILLDLTGLFTPGAVRRVRLRTNLEIYWDFLGTATELPASRMQIHEIAPAVADLHYRGYSRMRQAKWSSPELPDYTTRVATGQVWMDLVGYYTRYGDVRPLLSAVDDRYVIMNAGDEMTLQFPAADAAPPSGWKRDYVLDADGWVKDGDLNTAFSKTVLPLPSHADPGYNHPPGRLDDDPVYRAHKADWQTYHTRYVTPRSFMGAVRK